MSNTECCPETTVQALASAQHAVNLARLLRAGLPRPVRQHELRSEGGSLVAPFALAYPAAPIAVEFRATGTTTAVIPWRRDKVRGNGAAAEDWLVFGCTEEDVREQRRDAVGHIVRAYAARVTPKLGAA